MKKIGRPTTKTDKTRRTRISVTLTMAEKDQLRKIGKSVSNGISVLLRKNARAKQKTNTPQRDIDWLMEGSETPA